jgi:hypothetical protein
LEYGFTRGTSTQEQGGKKRGRKAYKYVSESLGFSANYNNKASENTGN